MRFILFSLLTMFFVIPAVQAGDDLMVLWPKQRAAHQIVIDDHQESYRARGQEFVEHMYATGGEEQMPDAEASIASIGDAVNPKPVDVEEVAKIVKDSPAADDVSAPAEENAVAPNYDLGAQ